jgi:hypothetical protein
MCFGSLLHSQSRSLENSLLLTLGCGSDLAGGGTHAHAQVEVTVDRLALAFEYLALARQHPVPNTWVRYHLRHICVHEVRRLASLAFAFLSFIRWQPVLPT